MPDSLERIYRSIPTVACRGLCAGSCGPIEMSDEERRRIAERGVTIPPAAEAIQAILSGQRTADCPALVAGRCSVYEDRPLICRLWGAVESMPCPYGCEVTPGLLMDAGARTLITRSLAVGGRAAGHPCGLCHAPNGNPYSDEFGTAWVCDQCRWVDPNNR